MNVFAKVEGVQKKSRPNLEREKFVYKKSNENPMKIEL